MDISNNFHQKFSGGIFFKKVPPHQYLYLEVFNYETKEGKKKSGRDLSAIAALMNQKGGEGND